MSDKPDNLNSLYVWITALSAAYERDIIHALILRGYQIALINDQITLVGHNTAGVITALEVIQDNINYSEFYSILVDILNSLKAKYYSIVISIPNPNCLWATGNIHIDLSSLERKPTTSLN